MISLRLFFVVTILLFYQFLAAQELIINRPGNLPSGKYPVLKLQNPTPKSDNKLKYDHQYKPVLFDSLSIQPSYLNLTQNRVVKPQWLKSAILPASLIIGGAITLWPENHCLLSKYRIQQNELKMFPGINTPIDNYLQFMPLVAVFGLKAAGVRSRSDLANQIAITAKSELLMGVIVRTMKNYIRIERPSGGGMNSMPSGHTAEAFVTATILDMEYRDTSPWISVGGYAAATTTAIGRLVNNKHWVSDVLIGAGIGIFSVKAVYFTHQYHWGKKNNHIVILPAIYKDGGGVTFAMML